MCYYREYSLKRIEELLTSEKVVSLKKARMLLSEILKNNTIFRGLPPVDFVSYDVAGDLLFTNENFEFSTLTKYNTCVIGGNATITDSTETELLYVHGNLIPESVNYID